MVNFVVPTYVNDSDDAPLKVKGVKDAELPDMKTVFLYACHLLMLNEIGIFNKPANFPTNSLGYFRLAKA